MLFHSSIRKELARSFGATLIVLVTVVMTMTLIRTLGQASRGSFNPSDVMLVMGYNVLAFLPNIMTMGLFVATVSTLTRMYRDSEMVIWFNSGVGLGMVLRPVLRFAWPVLLAVGGLALFVLPWSYQQIEDMKSHYENRGDLERVQPGQFQESGGGSKVFFVEKSLLAQQTASNVFMATKEAGKETITTARSGRVETQADERYLVLENGQRLESQIGQTSLRVMAFEQYRVLADQGVLGSAPEIPLNTVPTLKLLQDPTPTHLGEIAFRSGFALAALNLLIIALAATRVNPRVGRSWNLVFSLLVFQVYLNLLSLGQTWVATQQMAFAPFMVTLHGGVLLFGLAWLYKRHHNLGISWVKKKVTS
jgi:lipopolysaccharide export system permease protein